MRILVTDDSKYQRFLITSLLQEYGHCDEARDGKEAVDLFLAALESNDPYDLVVMDILMPVMDGHAALKRIREIQEEAGAGPDEMAAALMLSSLDDPKHMMEAQYRSGADAYLTKPFDEATLRQALVGLGLAESPVPLPDDPADDSGGDGEDPCIVL